MSKNNNFSIADVDNNSSLQQQQQQYYYANSESSSQPSAPTQNDLYTPLLNNYSYQAVTQPQYQTITMPQQPYYNSSMPRYIIRKKNSDDKRFPIQASVFLLGCIAPPIWFIALCLPNTNRYEIAWRKINICMICLTSIICVLITILFAFISYEDYKNHGDPDPDWRIPSISYFLE